VAARLDLPHHAVIVVRDEQSAIRLDGQTQEPGYASSRARQGRSDATSFAVQSEVKRAWGSKPRAGLSPARKRP
jgi:hypothetical protein